MISDETKYYEDRIVHLLDILVNIRGYHTPDIFGFCGVCRVEFPCEQYALVDNELKWLED